MRNDDFLELVLSDDPDVVTDVWIHWKDDTALTVLKNVQSSPSRMYGVWYIPHKMTEGVLATANVEDAKVRYFSVVERRVDKTGFEASDTAREPDCLTCERDDDATRPDTSSENVDDHHDLCICRSESERCDSCAPDCCACECGTLERLDSLGALHCPTSVEESTRISEEFQASLDGFLRDLTVEWGVSPDWIETVLTQGKSRLHQSALLVQIYAALHILHSGDLSKQWMTIPNTNQLFGGATPLHYAMVRENGLADILTLLQGRLGRSVADAWTGP